MAKQNPDLFLIKIGDGADPEVFDRLCGLNTRSFTIGGNEIDVSTIPCDENGGNAWQEMAHGLRRVSFSGSGFFESKAQSTTLVESKMTGDGKVNLQVVVPGLGEFEGTFLIGDLGLGAELDGGAVSQDVAFSSASLITFTAEA